MRVGLVASTRNSPSIPVLRTGPRAGTLAPLLAIPGRSRFAGGRRRPVARASASSTVNAILAIELSASSVDSQFPANPASPVSGDVLWLAPLLTCQGIARDE